MTSEKPDVPTDIAAFLRATLADLVSFDTQSSTGTTGAAIPYLERVLRETLGFQTRVFPFAPNPRCEQLLAFRRADHHAVLLCGHIDTVDANDVTRWDSDPLVLSERRVAGETRLYGRGTTDMKGGLASLLGALLLLVERGVCLDDVALCVTCEEETGVRGARDLLGSGAVDLSSVRTVVIAEPTGLRLGVAENGNFWFELAATGRAAHGSEPELGVNAVDAVCGALSTVRSKLAARYAGLHTMSVGTLHGGDAVNIVPSYAAARVDVRVRPGLDVDLVEAAVSDAVQSHAAETRAELRLETLTKNPSFQCGEDNALRRRFVAALGSDGENTCVTLPYTTDGAVFKAFLPRADVLLFGPGEVSCMHAYNEYVTLEALVKAAQVLADVLSK